MNEKAKEFYERGMACLVTRKRNDLIEAEVLFGEAAEGGCPEAMFELGMMKLGLKEKAELDEDTEYEPEKDDIEEGLSLLKKSAELGCLDAQVKLSEIYYGCEDGLDVEEDLAESAKWCEMAANAGNVSSMAVLGDMYKSGNGVPVDDARAFSLLKAAADAGSTEAKHYLIDMYFDGRGTEKNVHAALTMMMEARRFSNNGRDFVRYYKEGLVPEEMFREFEADLDGYADSDAVKTVGDLYYEGAKVEKDLKKAFECYKKVADHGPYPGEMYYKIATMYEKGEGVDADQKLAIENYQNAQRFHVKDADAALKRLGVQ